MATSEWVLPTLADTGATESVKCRCKRTRRPMDMLEVHGIPACEGAAWLCTTCIEDLYRRGTLDRVELHRAKGAPTEWLEAFEAKLKAGPLLRTGLPQQVWGEILADAMDRGIAKEEAQRVAPDEEPK